MCGLQRIFISGGNRGLGKELVKLVNLNHPNMEINISSRSSSQQLSNQWKKTLPPHHFKCNQMDLSAKQSINSVAKGLKERGVLFDFLVANAGICFTGDLGSALPSLEVASSTLKINIDSTIYFIKSFLPLMTSSGRIVVVSSFMGNLRQQHPPFKKKLENLNITEEQILQLSQAYVRAVADKEMGYFSQSSYKTSKALINAWVRFVLPRQLKQKQSVVAMHPGWCSTELGGPKAPLTPLQGATRIYDCLWLKQIVPGKFYNTKFCDYETCL